MGAIRRSKTKRRMRDLDQVHADLRSPKHLSQHKNLKAADDLPGLGQHYCVQCAKWFESEYNLKQHRRGKNHKRRVRLLKEEPYSQREAEAAVGLGVDNGSFERTAMDESTPTIEQEMDVTEDREGEDDELPQ